MLRNRNVQFFIALTVCLPVIWATSGWGYEEALIVSGLAVLVVWVTLVEFLPARRRPWWRSPNG
jgi:ABC-type uncharacterized transport system permease subunit